MPMINHTQDGVGGATTAATGAGGSGADTTVKLLTTLGSLGTGSMAFTLQK